MSLGGCAGLCWFTSSHGGGLKAWVQGRAEHFSSRGTNTVAVSVPAWALGSLGALPWEQGANFSFTHEMCSVCPHNSAFVC